MSREKIVEPREKIAELHKELKGKTKEKMKEKIAEPPPLRRTGYHVSIL
jgi:hypothetical protein